MYIHVHVYNTHTHVHVHIQYVTGDVERKKDRKNERHLRTRHSVLQTDALPTELPRQPSWQGTCTCTQMNLVKTI